MQEITDRGKASKVSAASRILSELERTAERAQKVAILVMERTASVTEPQPPSGESEKQIPAAREFPELFENIKLKTVSINNSLAKIEDVMQRCEL